MHTIIMSCKLLLGFFQLFIKQDSFFQFAYFAID